LSGKNIFKLNVVVEEGCSWLQSNLWLKPAHGLSHVYVPLICEAGYCRAEIKPIDHYFDTSVEYEIMVLMVGKNADDATKLTEWKLAKLNVKDAIVRQISAERSSDQLEDVFERVHAEWRPLFESAIKPRSSRITILLFTLIVLAPWIYLLTTVRFPAFFML